MLTLSGFNKLRIGVTTLPAVLKTRSDGVLVAHMHRYFRANFAMNGNLFLFVFHQVSGSSSPSMAISCRYMVISCSSVSVAAVAALFPRRLPKDYFFFLGTGAVQASPSPSPACTGPGGVLGRDIAISATISSIISDFVD